MIGATVAAHAVCAPIAGDGVEAEVPFGLGAVAGGGYNPPMSRAVRRLSELDPETLTQSDIEDVFEDVFEDDIEFEPFRPDLESLQAYWDRMLQEARERQEQQARALALKEALEQDDAEQVMALYEQDMQAAIAVVMDIIKAAEDYMRLHSDELEGDTDEQ